VAYCRLAAWHIALGRLTFWKIRPSGGLVAENGRSFAKNPTRQTDWNSLPTFLSRLEMQQSLAVIAANCTCAQQLSTQIGTLKIVEVFFYFLANHHFIINCLTFSPSNPSSRLCLLFPGLFFFSSMQKWTIDVH
jgi:hypothetical protein